MSRWRAEGESGASWRLVDGEMEVFWWRAGVSRWRDGGESVASRR